MAERLDASCRHIQIAMPTAACGTDFTEMIGQDSSLGRSPQAAERAVHPTHAMALGLNIAMASAWPSQCITL